MEIKRVLGMNAFCETGTMDKVVEFFRDALGAEIGPDMPWTAQYGFRAKGAWLGTGEPFLVEIGESTNDELVTGKQHKRSAPCFQNLALVVEDIDGAIAELRAKGIRVSDKFEIEDPQLGVLSQCTIHPKSAFGLLIELAEFKGKKP